MEGNTRPEIVHTLTVANSELVCLRFSQAFNGIHPLDPLWSVTRIPSLTSDSSVTRNEGMVSGNEFLLIRE